MSVSSLQDVSILVIDDDFANVDLLEAMLRDEGYSNITTTSDPRHALPLFLTCDPDLILLDTHMPYIDGFGLLRQFHSATKAGDYRPIMLLTADITPDTRYRALAEGASDIQTKPLDATELLLRIRNLLQLRLLVLARAQLQDTIATATAPERIPGVVFLCHSFQDKPQVRQLYVRLLTDGFDPWLDEQNLLPGDDWAAVIAKTIRSAAIIVVCLSTESISTRGYIQREITRALDASEEQPEGTIFIVPARIDPCAVPERLARWHWVDLFEAGGYGKLTEALRRQLQRSVS